MMKLGNLQIGSAMMTGGHVFQSATAFAINLLLVRYISPSEFGWFAIVFAEASLFFSVISIRTNMLIIRASEAALDDETKDLYFNAALLETVVATAAIFAWLWLTSGIGHWETIIVLTLAARHWTILNEAFFERRLPYKELSIIETGSALSGQAVALFVVLAGGGWIALVLREVFITITRLFGLIRVGGLTVRRLRLLTLAEYRRLYIESRGLWLDGLLEGTFQRLTILAAGYFGGDALAGLLFQAQRLASMPQLILAPFVNRIIMNWFAREEDQVRRRRGRNKAVLAIILPLCGIAGLAAVFADPVVPWLLGEDWAAVSAMIVAMTGYIVFASPFEILRSYCFAIHHTRMVLAARVSQHLGFFVSIGLAMMGVQNMSVGLAGGFSIAYAAAFMTVLGLVIRHDRTG